MKPTSIKSAKYLFDYKIKFELNNGQSVTTDFEPIISDRHANPMTSKYLDIQKFKKFKILSDRDISWGRNREMCFSFETISKGGKVPPIDRNELKKTAIKYFGKKEAERMFAESEMA